jgi:hypothetical protein
MTTTGEGLPTQDLFDRIQSLSLATGLFDAVNTAEPKTPPGTGITCGIWVNRILPIDTSGLDTITIRLDFNVRIYSSLVIFPSDIIDPNIVRATSTLMDKFAQDLDLGGLAREIDFFGSYGVPMDAQAGYLAQPGGVVNRVMTITLPIIVNDVWKEALSG